MTKHGILIISHGSRDVSWVNNVDMTINSAKASFYSDMCKSKDMTMTEAEQLYPIESAYLELVDGRLIQDGINSLQNKGVTHIDVLPLFVSAGSTHVEEIRQAFGFSPAYDFIGDLEPLECKCKVNFDLPLIDDIELVTIISRQLKSFNIDAEQHAVLIIGHGSSVETYYQMWETGMMELIQKLKLEFPQLPLYYAALLPDNAQQTMTLLSELNREIIVIPLFLSAGYFTNKVIPNRLNGFNYTYNGETLLPSEEMIQLLLRRYKALIHI